MEKVYVEAKCTAEAVDKLLTLPAVPAPEDYGEWEREYSKRKDPCDAQ